MSIETPSTNPRANPFEYRAPTDAQKLDMASISSACKLVYSMLTDHPGSPEMTLAIRKLQEARMWANVAILGIGLDRPPVFTIVPPAEAPPISCAMCSSFCTDEICPAPGE